MLVWGGMLTFLALAHMLDATQNAGLGWGGSNVPCTCTHVGCYARCWVGVGGMLTFLALAHMLDATQDAGLGWGEVNVPCTCTHVGCYARCWVGVGGMLTGGWGGEDVNVPCTCTHVGCYARCFSLHELLQIMVAKSLLERKWSTKCGASLMISCPSPSIISPKQPDWSMIRSGSICTVGNGDNAGKDLWTNMQEVFAEWKKRRRWFATQIQARP